MASETATTQSLPAAATRRRSVAAVTLGKVRRDRYAMVGAALVAIFLLVAIVGAIVAPNPLAQTAAVLRPPSAAHLLGTDDLGRDLLARCAAGAWISLEVALGSAVVAVVIGMPIGMIAGYFATTWVDETVMRGVDVILALPLLVLALVVLGFLGSGPLVIAGVSFPVVVKVIGLVGLAGVPLFARVARGSVLVERQEDYVDALRVLGVSRMRILFGDILVNALPPIIVQFMLWLAVGVFTEAGLSYLGIGVQPPNPTLGNILLESQPYILLGYWWFAVAPGLLLVAVIAGFNLLGEAIARAFEPESSS
jgi:peptide/nickel transport system permease protein